MLCKPFGTAFGYLSTSTWTAEWLSQRRRIHIRANQPARFVHDIRSLAFKTAFWIVRIHSHEHPPATRYCSQSCQRITTYTPQVTVRLPPTDPLLVVAMIYGFLPWLVPAPSRCYRFAWCAMQIVEFQFSRFHTLAFPIFGQSYSSLLEEYQ